MKHRRTSLAVLAVLSFVLAPAIAAADASGHWRDSANAFAELAQVGAGVTMHFTGNPSVVYEGTFSGSTLALVTDDLPYPDSYSLELSPDETSFVGIHHTYGCFLSFCTTLSDAVTLDRCGCFDDNRTNGDGCDFQCRTEVCNSCAGDPSTCAPLADSTPCENPSACTTGGTCNAGFCEGGAAVDTCIDMGGRWLRVTSSFDDNDTFVDQSEIVQSGNDLTLYQMPGGILETNGVVDPATGAVAFGGENGWPVCGGLSPEGAMAPDGLSYAATAWSSWSTPHGCIPADLYGEIGVRCAPPSLHPSDGCLVDSCQSCSGDPVVCEPLPDATPCQSADPCTVLATCQRGECVASISDECPVCTACDGAGGCVAAPRSNCRDTDQPKSTVLSIRHDDGGKNQLRWQWKDGDAIRSFDVSRPDLYKDVALCVFDESGSAPALLFAAFVNGEPHFFEPIEPLETAPGWKMSSDGGARFRDSDGNGSGVTGLEIRLGSAGDARVKIKGKGAGLATPNPALPLPLRAQLQIEGGACFEGTYGAEGVSRNSDGVFKAKGTP